MLPGFCHHLCGSLHISELPKGRMMTVDSSLMSHRSWCFAHSEDRGVSGVINIEIVSTPSHYKMETLNFPLAVRCLTSAHSVRGTALASGGGTRGSRHETKTSWRPRACVWKSTHVPSCCSFIVSGAPKWGKLMALKGAGCAFPESLWDKCSKKTAIRHFMASDLETTSSKTSWQMTLVEKLSEHERNRSMIPDPKSSVNWKFTWLIWQ